MGMLQNRYDASLDALIAAMIHPVRRRIAFVLGEAPATDVQLAERLDVRPSEVRRSLRALIEAGMIVERDGGSYAAGGRMHVHTQLGRTCLAIDSADGGRLEIAVLAG